MEKINEIVEELQLQIMDANSKVFYTEDEKESLLGYYKEALVSLFLDNTDAILEIFNKIANLKMLKNIPHTILFHEIEFIKNRVANEILLQKNALKLFELFELFKKIENNIGRIHIIKEYPLPIFYHPILLVP